MDKYNEADILSQLKDPSKKHRAFEKIVGHYNQTLYWQIRRIVTNHDDADDVLQNTYVKAWNSIDSFRGDSKLSTWLYKIAYNESITFLSHKRDIVSIDDTDENNIANQIESDEYFDGDETQAMLQNAISTLPDKQKAVFTMKYFQEMKYEEMSEIFGTSVGALKASYHIAVKKIEDFFNKND